jgi:hypothetical protein
MLELLRQDGTCREPTGFQSWNMRIYCCSRQNISRLAQSLFILYKSLENFPNDVDLLAFLRCYVASHGRSNYGGRVGCSSWPAGAWQPADRK